MMSVSPTLVNRVANIPMQFAFPVSEGTITYDASSKNVTVTGSTTADQSISIYLDPSNPSLVDISISNSGLPITQEVQRFQRRGDLRERLQWKRHHR